MIRTITINLFQTVGGLIFSAVLFALISTGNSIPGYFAHFLPRQPC